MINNFSTIPPEHVLRGILRYLKKSCPSCTTPSTVPLAHGSTQKRDTSMRQYLLLQYRDTLAKSLTPDSSVAVQKRRLAYDYYLLLSNISERGRLFELDGGVETKLSPKEYTRRAAARAGLIVPGSSSSST
jgi:hypothetical protein